MSSVLWERGAPVPRSEREALRAVAGQFEALFIEEMLRSMRSTVPESGLLGKDRATKMYREMHDQALAANLATSGAFGIGRMLEENLARSSLIR